MAKSKDLFDESTMTFGEHLEALRKHLIRALLGLVVAMAATLTWGNRLIDVIRTPIDHALKRNAILNEDNVSGFDFWGQVGSWFKASPPPDPAAEEKLRQAAESAANTDPTAIIVHIKPTDLLRALHEADPQRFPAPAARADETPLSLAIAAQEFREFRQTANEFHRPVTLNVQEAFMMYIKVALVSGLIFASPWILYQFWQFVAAGLYPHERRYVHVYLPLSVGLFLFGSVFCFYLALPLVLDFLLSYNRWLQVVPQIRLSEWVNFVIVLPLMFGISFQLPIVLLFLERIGVFTASDYREKRRLAVFVIAVAAMLLSPGGDPGSMMLMFLPLVALYELGIILCGFLKVKQPFEEEPAAS